MEPENLNVSNNPKSSTPEVRFNVPLNPEDPYIPPTRTSSSTTPNGGSVSKLALAAAFLVVLGGLYFYSVYRLAPVSGPKIIGLEVALKTSTFLDTTIRLDGSMIGGYICGDPTPADCRAENLSAEQPHLGQAIYSYFLLSEATGDLTLREKADRAINHVMDACETDVRMCAWNFFPLAQYYEKTGDEVYLTRGMLPPSEGFLLLPNEEAITNNVGHKLASLYLATQDERFKDRLLEIADAELLTWSEGISNTGNAARSIQVAWSIFEPAYRISSDEKYLIAAEQFFAVFDVAKNIAQFKDGAVVNVAIKAGDVLLSLSKVSNSGAVYKDQAHRLLQELLNGLWDTPEYKSFSGDYGFIDNMNKDPLAYKSTLLNGWIMKLFILMKDEVFEQPVNAG